MIAMNIDIRKIRRDLNLSQQEFAEKLGVTQTLISKIEAGKSRPTFKMISKINEVFGISLSYILFGKEHEEMMFGGDNINDGDGNTYLPKNRKTSARTDEEWFALVDRLVGIIESKDRQIESMVETIKNLTLSITGKS